MSLIHWDKSVLTFHLREVMEDHNAGNEAALVSVGAILLGAIALPSITKMSRPVIKTLVTRGLSPLPSSSQDLTRGLSPLFNVATFNAALTHKPPQNHPTPQEIFNN